MVLEQKDAGSFGSKAEPVHCFLYREFAEIRPAAGSSSARLRVVAMDFRLDNRNATVTCPRGDTCARRRLVARELVQRYVDQFD
ncbi:MULTISPECIES: hypothetical protein [Paraburkholderia]|uniref:hypothetical protein n=1 Tax=Paraburkholderia TaxID=1822464 RepID=UPI002250E8AA|nr:MULTISPECIES: hypothetical protein [Paraburkholderia]MCX4177441.1 hypothetical protein [Paraburkholderia madseniana]MDQ6465430.1 hypothetical protein [Paraburkholderia madseniana]